MTKAHPASDIYNTERRWKLELLLKAERRNRHATNPMTSEEFNNRLERIYARYPVYHRSYEIEYRATMVVEAHAPQIEVNIENLVRTEETQKFVDFGRNNEKLEALRIRDDEITDKFLDKLAADPKGKKYVMHIELAEEYELTEDRISRIVNKVLAARGVKECK